MMSKPKKLMPLKSRRMGKNQRKVKSSVMLSGLSTQSQPVPLVSVDQEPKTFITDCGHVPTILVNAAKILEKNVTVKDLFQTQGSMEHVVEFSNSLRKKDTLPRYLTVHDVAEVVKYHLASWAPKIIPDDVMLGLIDAQQYGTAEDFSTVLQQYRQQMTVVVTSVHFVIQLLNKVSLHSHLNGMDARKLATIFVLDVLKPLSNVDDDEKRRLQRVQKLPYDIMVIEHLIRNVHLFETSVPCSKVSPPAAQKEEDTHCEAGHDGAKEDFRKEYNILAECSKAMTDGWSQNEMVSQQLLEVVKIKEEIEAEDELAVTKPPPPQHFGLNTIPSSLNKSAPIPSKDSVKKAPNSQPKRKAVTKGGLRKGQRSSSLKLWDRLSLKKQCPQKRAKSIGGQCTRLSSDPTGSGSGPGTGNRGGVARPRSVSKDRADIRATSNTGLLTKKKGKKGKGKSVGRISSSMFESNEDLMPWEEADSEGEDVSLMARSINHAKSFVFLDNFRKTTTQQDEGIVDLNFVTNASKSSSLPLEIPNSQNSGNIVLPTYGSKSPITRLSRPERVRRKLAYRSVSRTSSLKEVKVQESGHRFQRTPALKGKENSNNITKPGKDQNDPEPVDKTTDVTSAEVKAKGSQLEIENNDAVQKASPAIGGCRKISRRAKFKIDKKVIHSPRKYPKSKPANARRGKWLSVLDIFLMAFGLLGTACVYHFMSSSQTSIFHRLFNRFVSPSFFSSSAHP